MRACSSSVSSGSRRCASSGGIADRLGAERVEPGREVAVHAVRLDERHRGRDAAEQLAVDLGGLGRRFLRRGRGGMAVPAVAAVPRRVLEQAGEAGQRGDDVGVAALEQRAPLGEHGLGVLEVLVEQQTRIARVHAVDVVHSHSDCCISVAGRAESPGPGSRR